MRSSKETGGLESAVPQAFAGVYSHCDIQGTTFHMEVVQKPGYLGALQVITKRRERSCVVSAEGIRGDKC